MALFGSGFKLLGAEVFCFEIAIMGFQLVAIQMERIDQVGARLGCAGYSPLGQMRRDGLLRELHRLHHLPDESVGEQDDGIAVAVGQLEGERS